MTNGNIKQRASGGLWKILWLRFSDIILEFNLRTAIHVAVNSDDKSKDGNQRVQRDLVDHRAWVCVCVGTWICHISSFAKLQCYITRERERWK